MALFKSHEFEDVSAVLSSLGMDEQAQALIAPGWQESRQTLPEEIPFLQETFLTPVLEYCGIAGENAAAVQEAAAAVRHHEAMRRFVWHVFYKFSVQPMFEGSKSSGFTGWPNPEPVDNAGKYVWLLALLGTIPEAIRAYRAENVPEEVIRETLFFGSKPQNPFVPIDSTALEWTRQYRTARLFVLGRFLYRVMKNLHKGVLLRHRIRGNKVMVCGPGVSLTKEGLLVIPGHETPADISAPFEESTDAVRGFPVDPRGYVILSLHNFSLKEWEIVLRPGDKIIDMHIPGGGGMTPERCFDSFKRAADFFPGREPEIKPIIISHSWIFDSRYEALIPNSNMAYLMRQTYVYPWNSKGDDGLYFLFGNTRYASLADYPRDTSLRRAMLSLLEKGEPLRRGGMLLAVEDIPFFGQEFYRSTFSLQ